jgi:Na+/H+ antiporter NhaD/arsenite permease-like protein
MAPALLASGPAQAEALAGGALPLVWTLPFGGVLLSIALGPLVIPRLWHAHYGKIAALWAFAVFCGICLVQGTTVAVDAVLHVLIQDYVPFILMLFALFTAAGGIVVRGRMHPSPLINTAILGAGTLIASLIGTTGASMVLIRPLVRANERRHYSPHIVVFFIFLVSNIGGSLTPLGDPPLFLGFLRGIDFFWTARHLWPHFLFASGVLLAAFFVLDTVLIRRSPPAPHPDDSPVSVEGLLNMALVLVAVAAVALSGMWKPGVAFHVAGIPVEGQDLARNLAMLAVGLVSLATTPRANRTANGFTWEPMIEVAKLFAAIFVCLVPVMAMLQAGRAGAFAPLVALATGPDGAPRAIAYFWLTGMLSSFLDNAPTYLVFFELAGGDPHMLMGPLSPTLTAISLGAVFMGALTYIGNAPNLMVHAIAVRAGIRMPGFFGYMLWSGLILIPLFLAITVLFLR